MLNNYLVNNMKEEFIITLKDNSDVFLSEIDHEYAGNLYFVEFKYIFDEKQTQLDLDDFIHGIKVLNAIVEINKTIDNCCLNIHNNSDPNNNWNLNECYIKLADELYSKLNESNAHIQDVRNESFKKRYLMSLTLAKQLKNNNNNGHNLILDDETDDNKHSASLSDSGHADSEFYYCNLLTHGEIQECISQTNADYEQECLAVVLINDSLTKDNVLHTLYLLKNSLPKDDKYLVMDQNAFIYHNELKKMKCMNEVLSIDDIRFGIKNCNNLLENALNMTKTMILINQIDESKKNEIINLLKDKSLGMKLLNQTECADLYYQTFKDLKRICKSIYKF